ncbi:MAG: hypothetical protein KatS3mg015_2814 [Fimbriimonadales bacterium]|nr:MAG: hypothetical protein KatS3mg015_2814 [Fimbriimonadales bacterium]
MSSYENPGQRAETQQQQQRQGPEAFLSSEERRQLRRFLGFPEDFPPKFKSWLTDYLSVAFPEIPVTQISGFDKYLYKKGVDLPANPRDGQPYAYVADSSKGIVWRFMYNADSGSQYKWEFIGGAPAQVAASGNVSTTSASWQDLGGPSLTVPLAGDYLVQFGAEFNNNVNGRDTLMAVAAATASITTETTIQMEGVGGRVALARSSIVNAPSPGSTLRCYYRILTQDCTGFWRNRWLLVQPVRVKKA